VPGLERVLVSGEELTGGLAAVRALRADGFEPWLALTRTDAPAGRSRACGGVVETPDPALDPKAFAESAARTAERIRAVAVLPGSEDALLAVAPHLELFPAGLAVGCPELAVVRRALDKSAVNTLAGEAGLQTIPSLAVRPSEKLPEGISYPAVLKPAQTKVLTQAGTLEREPARLVGSEDELRRAMAGSPAGEWLVQPFLAGRLAASSGVAWNGKTVCLSHQQAERTWPLDLGISAFAETVPADEGREEGVRRLIEALNWSGIFQMQFLVVDGDAYAIDFNPRIYGSLALAVAAGLNLPAIWVSLLLGRPSGPLGYRVGVRYRAEGNDLRALITTARRGGLATAIRGALPRRRTVHAVFSSRDPRPALVRFSELARGRG
jgi:predicted ATP-grasp superfamily ATP-dependent carboligase